MSFSLTALSFFSVLLWSLATIFCSLGTGWWGKKAAPAPLVSRARTMLRFLQLALSKWSQRKKKKKKRVGRNGKKKRPDREKREWAEISLRGGVCLILSSLNDESLETADIHPKWILFHYLRSNSVASFVLLSQILSHQKWICIPEGNSRNILQLDAVWVFL